MMCHRIGRPPISTSASVETPSPRGGACPAPRRGRRPSSAFHLAEPPPGVRDARVFWRDPDDLARVVRQRRAVRDHRIARAEPDEPVPHTRGNPDARVAVGAELDLLNLPARRRVHPVVVQHELDASQWDRVVQGHRLVQMPPFDPAGMDEGEVDLAETLERGVVGTEHMEDGATLVGNPSKGIDSHAVDHARSSRYQATTSGSDSAKRRFASQPSILRAFVESRYWTGISPTASFRMIGSTFPPTAAVTRSTTSRAVRRSPELKLKASPGAAPSANAMVR